MAAAVGMPDREAHKALPTFAYGPRPLSGTIEGAAKRQRSLDHTDRG